MKTPIIKIAIVGAGGIGIQLLPVLSLDHDIVLIDGDNFEPHNSTRQFPALGSTGNKAEVLQGLQYDRTLKEISYIPRYLEGITITNDPAFKDIDLIISAVDNNESRRIIVELAEDLEIPAILCGNETECGEAHLVIPGVYNPFDHHDFGDDTPAPFSCTSDENKESAAQTSAANFLAAGCCVHILSNLKRLGLKKPDFLTIHSLMDNRSGSSSTRLIELKK